MACQHCLINVFGDKHQNNLGIRLIFVVWGSNKLWFNMARFHQVFCKGPPFQPSIFGTIVIVYKLTSCWGCTQWCERDAEWFVLSQQFVTILLTSLSAFLGYHSPVYVDKTCSHLTSKAKQAPLGAHMAAMSAFSLVLDLGLLNKVVPLRWCTGGQTLSCYIGNSLQSMSIPGKFLTNSWQIPCCKYFNWTRGLKSLNWTSKKCLE